MGRTKKQEVQYISQQFEVSMNRTIKALGVAKSSIYYKAKPYPTRKSKVRKALDPAVKSAILTIAKNKATYGVPRVRAILKRDYDMVVSKYSVHKFMKEADLLIKRGRKRGANRPHTGTISVDTSNTRWASDITSIKCWNGQKLRFSYILDCCDRSIIAWKAGLHMQACDIELMLQEALFNRFGAQLPNKNSLQFLHDNGPEYIERNLRKQLKDWNIEDCSTPVYSPQSNGMCEAFNGTFKRDYVYENCLENPITVKNQIQDWVNQYNQYAPHSALNMKTPQEFFKFKTAA